MSSNKGKETISDAAPQIDYSGFKDIEQVDMLQIQKTTQEFADKVLGHGLRFRRLSVRMKAIHKVENNQKFEIHVAIEGFRKTRSAEVTDKNIFKALDLACKKLLVEVQKER